MECIIIHTRRRRCALDLFVCVFLSCFVTGTIGSRNWRDIQSIHYDEYFHPIDTSVLIYMQQQQLYYKTTAKGDLRLQQPQSQQNRQPTTIAPSPSPSSQPTVAPSAIPTIKPSASPTALPTSSPTSAPTIDLFKNHIPPDHPDPWYFNYEFNSNNNIDENENADSAIQLVQNGNGFLAVDTGTTTTTATSSWSWGNVVRPPNDYWDEFTNDKGYGPWKSVLSNYFTTNQNQCTIGQMQSPIDVQSSTINAICYEKHQVRYRPGNTNGQDIIKRIESNKLRLIYPRRSCSNITECYDPIDPPHADFPHGWGGFADLLHIDIKLPSEHQLLHQIRYDGEIQLFHLHAGRRRLAAISILIHATIDGYNYYFDEVIQAFQIEYNNNAAKCNTKNSRRRTNLIPNFFEWAKNVTLSGRNHNHNDSDNHSDSNTPPPQQQQQFTDKIWNPYHPMIVPSIYFYRYEGSLTEPPCGEFVSWWITDEPMVISLDQLEQLKILLFTNVDGNTCQTTSVQYEESVARPIQPTNNRPIWKCTSAEFGPDIP